MEPQTTVYIGKIPNSLEIKSIYPKARLDEINACSSQKAKREKYCAWKLLEYAIKDALNLEISEIDFEKSINGKWLCKDFYFSISHSYDMVCVAISKSPVGIDIEKISEKLKRIMPRYLTDSENKELSSINESDLLEHLCTKWTQKESIFKSWDKKAFTPSKIDTSLYKTSTYKIENYIVSICTDENIQIFKDTDYLIQGE